MNANVYQVKFDEDNKKIRFEDGREFRLVPIPTSKENKENDISRNLIGNMDAKIWAEEFVKIVKQKPEIPTDEGTMIGWFANAIIVGYDENDKKHLTHINKDEKCPKCNNYTLIPEHNGVITGENSCMIWDYRCTHCGAKFFDDTRLNKNE